LKQKFLDAAKAGDVCTVQDLTTEGANVNSCDPYGFTALLHATIAENEALVKALLEHKPNVNCQLKGNSYTALHFAARLGNATIMKMLLDAGANPKLKNFDEITALDIDEDCEQLLENPQKENYQTFHEQMQRCQDLLRAHDEKSQEYPYFDDAYSCSALCRICQWKSVIQPNGIIYSCDLMLPDIQQAANHEKVFLKALENGIEFSPDVKNLWYESTNEGTNTDDENEYYCDDENESEKIESNFADWILEKIYRFKEKDFAENKLIQVHKIELMNDQERSKKFYKHSRSADKMVQTLEANLGTFAFVRGMFGNFLFADFQVTVRNLHRYQALLFHQNSLILDLRLHQEASS
jgi:hypothetical protein